MRAFTPIEPHEIRSRTSIESFFRQELVVEQADIGRRLDNFINPGYASYVFTKENVGSIIVQITFPNSYKKYWIFK